MDLCIWKSCPSGIFSSNSFARCLEVVPAVGRSTSFVWVGLALPTLEVFFWLAVSGAVCTIDVLGRTGNFLEDISDSCPLCGESSESVDHLSIHCSFSNGAWSRFLAKSGVTWCFSRSLVGLFEAWRLIPFFW